MSRRTNALAALAAVAGLLLTGCGVSMPESGPVVVTTATGATRDEGSVNINPRHPGKGDTPEQIVRGFLDAMTATPAIKTSVAREFLTHEARADWQPSGMVVYETVTTPRGNNSEVEAILSEADRTDARGAWLGPLTEDESTVRFPMEHEDGEWRISVPPPWLIVPKSWFEQRFRQVSLYFFDATGSLLVPEPVFVPGGQQFASSLVNGLLQGPAAELSTTELTYLPTDLRSVASSVPVSASGVAQVDLTSDSAAVQPTPTDAQLLVSQLAWTLRQDPTIERFEVTIAGRPVQLNGETEFSVDHGREYAPYVSAASTQLYGLRDGLMVAGGPQNLDPVGGPFGQDDYQLRTVVADLVGDRVAGVSADGTGLSVAPVNETGDPVTPLISTGQDLLRPAWDASGRLWEVDRGPNGAVVQYLRGKQMRTLEVPGISNEDVKDFLVSRDGSRLIAVIRQDAETNAIMVSRIITTGDGQVVGALTAEDITDPDDRSPIRDIAWRTATSIAVLYPGSRRRYQVRSASIDGAPSGLDSLSVTVVDEVVGLAGIPAPDEPTYAVISGGGLVDLAGPSADRIEVEPGVTSLGYAG